MYHNMEDSEDRGNPHKHREENIPTPHRKGLLLGSNPGLGNWGPGFDVGMKRLIGFMIKSR